MTGPASLEESSPVGTAELRSVAYVRSKNAGPFWLTIDIFFNRRSDYRMVSESNALDPRIISDLYSVPVEEIQLFRLPDLQAMKISFPRPLIAGSFADFDLHAGQQFVLLASLLVPVGLA